MDSLTQDLLVTAHEWRARLSNGLSQSDEAEFVEWMQADPAHGEAFAEAEILWGALGRVDLSKVELPALTPDLEPAEPSWWARKQDTFTLRAQRLVAASVTVALVFAAAWVFVPQFATEGQMSAEPMRYATGPSTSQLITLSDRSNVRLGPASALQVDYTESSRLLVLEQGQAQFSVVRDTARPFTVVTEPARVTVTGTRFLTELRDGGLEVAVFEGSVDVKAGVASAALESSNATISLAAGDNIWTMDGVTFSRLAFGDGSASRSVVSGAAALAREVRMTYRSAPLSQVIADMNSHSTSPIAIAAEAGDLKLTGTFDVSDTQSLLATLEMALPVSIERSEHGIMILDERAENRESDD